MQTVLQFVHRRKNNVFNPGLIKPSGALTLIIGDTDPGEILFSDFATYVQTIFFILEFKTNFLHEEMFEWSKKYGPVMTVHIGKSILCNIARKSNGCIQQMC